MGETGRRGLPGGVGHSSRAEEGSSPPPSPSLSGSRKAMATTPHPPRTRLQKHQAAVCYGSGFLFGFLLGFPLGDPGPLCFGSLFGFLWIPVGLHWIFLWFVLSDKVISGCVWPPMANAFTSFTLRMVIHI